MDRSSIDNNILKTNTGAGQVADLSGNYVILNLFVKFNPKF